MKRLLLAASLASLAAPSMAGSVSTTFGVSANVLETCSTVTATALAFGDYDPLNGADKDSTSTIDVTCSNGTPFTIKLDGGMHSDPQGRHMQRDGGAETLHYDLFSDAARTQVWGNGTVGDVVSGTGTGVVVQETVYGRVHGGQNEKPTGTYSDTITVNVDY